MQGVGRRWREVSGRFLGDLLPHNVISIKELRLLQEVAGGIYLYIHAHARARVYVYVVTPLNLQQPPAFRIISSLKDNGTSGFGGGRFADSVTKRPADLLLPPARCREEVVT